MKVLVLGGDGFVGSYLVEQALGLGHEISVFDRFLYNRANNLEHLRSKVCLIPGEFANRMDVANALEGQDIIYHFISATNAVTSWGNPSIEIEENIKYSVQLFELAVHQCVKKIVFVSSGGTVYGPQRGIIREDNLPRPFSPYGIGKLAIEHFLNYFREHYNIAADIYRVGNAYGPRQPMQTPQGVIAVWMGKILRNEILDVYGDADTYRDYIHVDDIAYLMTHSLNDLKQSDVYNLGTGQGISIIALLHVFLSAIDQPIRYELHPRRGLDNSSVVLDSSKLTAFFPRFSFQCLETKIQDTWTYVKQHHLMSYGKDAGI
ncbi:MAG TPA: hypothetical protein DCG53_06450 [Syntrophus sp. (in: bacteria)]|jgi:UDP-glucose 4-epimerase|nr:hypothetical protein [Syntrophus sp. (in: bacteria)]